MKINDELTTLINKRKNSHPDDPSISDIWNEMVNILKDNENETISLLNKCDKEELYWLSEIFEDLSYKFQSKRFIECLLELQEKYPDIELEEDIKFAVQSLDKKKS
ncbi:hypothetical protein [Virgibacillus sp. 6R]|uniref:hypothetical protein n=1 Tax=Metabacillus sp. 22489 TaxID=3453928 RepID=UPI0011A95287